MLSKVTEKISSKQDTAEKGEQLQEFSVLTYLKLISQTLGTFTNSNAIIQTLVIEAFLNG